MHTRVMEFHTEDALSVDKLVLMLREANGKGDGRFAILAAFKELEELGYVVRVRSRDAASGAWTVLTIVYGCPHAECKNLFGMDPGKAGKSGHTKRPGCHSGDADESSIPQPRRPDPFEHPIYDSRFAWSSPGAETECGKPDLNRYRATSTRKAKSKAAPMSEEQNTGSKADPVAEGDDPFWPKVTEIGQGVRLSA